MTPAERAALRAAGRLDVPSFPCLPDKKPACPNGFKAATLPQAGLATLWARHPGELVGVPTDIASGLSVLDVDIAKGGDGWWAENKARLPQTRMHETRSGGLHVCCSIVGTASATPPPRSGPASTYGQTADISSGGLRMASRLSVIRSPIGRTG